MKTAKIYIQQCVQDVDDLLSECQPSILKSRVLFAMQLDGKAHMNLSVEVTQKNGGCDAVDDVEVGEAVGYQGPFNQVFFSERVEQYYRTITGKRASRSSSESSMDLEHHAAGDFSMFTMEVFSATDSLTSTHNRI
ncbi:MAG: hypothetical protein AB8B86_11630 [Pseudomonadales bacterium]